MKPAFNMNTKDVKKLKKFMKDSPRDFQKASANVLTSLAFQTRKYDMVNIKRGMIVRDERFLKGSLKVTKSKNTSIDKQVAYAYSLKKKLFSGWEEQETGRQSKKKRKPLPASRTNKRQKMRMQARLKKSNKMVKPEQYQNNFGFMMRVLGSRGGGRFLLSKKILTKRGALGRGLYELVGGKGKRKGGQRGKINRLQSFDEAIRPKRYKWRTMSIKQLKNSDIKKIWAESIKRTVKKYK